MRALAPLLLAATSWCQPASTPPDGDGAAAAASPQQGAPLPEANRGDPLQATIPLYGEGIVELSDLRGRVVVLDFFSPAESAWVSEHMHWRSLRAANLESIEIVAVATGSTDTALVDHWDSEPPEHVVAWDPQGALVLRLGVESLPTIVVLDRLGRVVASGSDRAALRRTAASLL
ncbi:MAG: TlpA family protein disulfide reductase [Nannocystaceae bacterium]|nr:TlpA family protein disulfide reductase [Nannocystaceae bacterium]